MALSVAMCAAMPAVAASPAQPRWLEVRSTHFIVLSDSSEKDARRVATHFERMHMVFHALFPTQGDDSDPPIVVLAVKDRKGMKALEPEAYLAKGQVDIAGFFLRAADKNYILMRLDAEEEHAYSTVYHEYTHYMLRKADGWLPLWLNEGLAQFYENTDIDDKNAWLGQANAEELRYLNRIDLLPMATLLSIDTTSPYYHDEQKGSAFYAESWALTHFLIVSDRLQGTHRMHDYAQALAQGADAVTAARDVFGDLDKLQAALETYVMQRKFMYFMMPAPLADKDAALEVRAIPAGEADAVRADVLAYTGRADEARALAEAVLRSDPDNALAHQTMGSLSFREGDVAAARTWFGEASKLDPHSYRADYYYAVAALRQSGKSGSEVEDAEIESHLQDAIALNPEFAPSYDALAMFYALRRRKLEQAHTLNLRAVALDPASLSYRLDCAEVLAEQRQFADAIGVLKDALHLARTADEVAAVNSRMERIANFQSAVAGESAKLHNSPEVHAAAGEAAQSGGQGQ
jgi:tetratricopeptide (TPR) repeat protein